MKVKLASILPFLILLAACQSIGVPAPQTFAERLAAGYVTVTTIRQTATSLVSAEKLSPDDAVNVQAQADNARAGLDIARTLRGTDVSAADAKLQAAMTVLTALKAYLGTHQ